MSGKNTLEFAYNGFCLHHILLGPGRISICCVHCNSFVTASFIT